MVRHRALFCGTTGRWASESRRAGFAWVGNRDRLLRRSGRIALCLRGTLPVGWTPGETLTMILDPEELALARMYLTARAYGWLLPALAVGLVSPHLGFWLERLRQYRMSYLFAF